MLYLPRPNPLYEQIPAHKSRLPEMLARMGQGGFTGLLTYQADAYEGCLLFINGALTSALLLPSGQRRKTDLEAVTALFDLTVGGTGQFSIYRMTAELVACTQAILHGEQFMPPQEVRAVDLKALLAQLAQQAQTATVLFRTTERSAMIFYHAGTPIGFYHDTARELDKAPEEAQRIAALPGALVEVYAGQTSDLLAHHNLLEILNIDRLWESARQRCSSQTAPTAPEEPSDDTRLATLLPEIADDLQEIAAAYLGRCGAELVERLLQQTGGFMTLQDNTATSCFLESVQREAASLDPEARIDEMIGLMRSEITGRLLQ